MLHGDALQGGACVWLVRRRSDGEVEVLFQKRSEKVHNGGLYDASAGGHIDEGEDALTAALRETREEIGVALRAEDLRFVTQYATDMKLISVYLADRTGRDDAMTLDPEEVGSVEWVKLRDFDAFIRTRVKPPLREIPSHLPVLRYYIENYL
ncbi:NUDIX domain-containing protein [Candidatus Saccharibacteria bacterium]|nr:NUDIX domain-containing protein [Candidatus Saccharibacteria bacterium]